MGFDDLHERFRDLTIIGYKLGSKTRLTANDIPAGCELEYIGFEWYIIILKTASAYIYDVDDTEDVDLARLAEIDTAISELFNGVGKPPLQMFTVCKDCFPEYD